VRVASIGSPILKKREAEEFSVASKRSNREENSHALISLVVTIYFAGSCFVTDHLVKIT
jgi:hypothetical protein